MNIETITGNLSVADLSQLQSVLRNTRLGQYGAFILSHRTHGSSLWLHINGDIAYLHYFDGRYRHPGFQSENKTSSSADSIRFLLVGGSEADAIEMPTYCLLPAVAAYRAAEEYFEIDRMPPNVCWTEL